MPTYGSASGGTLRATVREAGIDSWSDVRSLHATAFRAFTAASLEQSQVAAFMHWVYSPDYTDTLVTQNVQTGWVGSQLVATAGWVPADAAGESARITSVFVSPLFSRLGIGRQIVEAAEARAAAAGFKSYACRVFPSALGFFEALGYSRSSQGALTLGTGAGIPVTFVRKPAVERPLDPAAAAQAG